MVGLNLQVQSSPAMPSLLGEKTVIAPLHWRPSPSRLTHPLSSPTADMGVGIPRRLLERRHLVTPPPLSFPISSSISPPIPHPRLF